MVAGTGSTTTHEAKTFRIVRTRELAEEQRKCRERTDIGSLRRYVPIILRPPPTSTDPRQRPSQQFASPVPQLLRTNINLDHAELNTGADALASAA